MSELERCRNENDEMWEIEDVMKWDDVKKGVRDIVEVWGLF